MADYEISVGFNTEELRSASAGGTGGGGAGGAGGGGLGLSISRGFKTALTGLGIVGLLANLKSVLDVIGFLIGIISTALAFLVNTFVQYLIPFFKDPSRAFIGLFVDVLNGLLTGIEFLSNTIIKGLNLIPGVNIDQVELPRFRKDIILEAYGNLEEVSVELSKGNASLEQVVEAQNNYTSSWFDALLTDEEFKKAQELSEVSGITLQESAKAVESLGVNASLVIAELSNSTIKIADSSFNELNNALEYIENRAREIQGDSPRTSSRRQTSSNTGGSELSFFDFIPIGIGYNIGEYLGNKVKERFNKNLGFRRG